jgi:hypothetical protein
VRKISPGGTMIGVVRASIAGENGTTLTSAATASANLAGQLADLLNQRALGAPGERGRQQ